MSFWLLFNLGYGIILPPEVAKGVALPFSSLASSNGSVKLMRNDISCTSVGYGISSASSKYGSTMTRVLSYNASYAPSSGYVIVSPRYGSIDFSASHLHKGCQNYLSQSGKECLRRYHSSLK